MVRVSEDVRQKLSNAAAKAGRSLSAEIALRLEKSFEDDSAAQEMADKVEYHEEAIRELRDTVEDLQRSVSALYSRP